MATETVNDPTEGSALLPKSDALYALSIAVEEDLYQSQHLSKLFGWIEQARNFIDVVRDGAQIDDAFKARLKKVCVAYNTPTWGEAESDALAAMNAVVTSNLIAVQSQITSASLAAVRSIRRGERAERGRHD